MKKKAVARKYKLTDASLKQLSDDILNSLDRDVHEFSERGMTATKRMEFVNAIDRFSNYPSDEQLEAIKIAATEEKDAARGLVEKAMRTIFLMAKNVFKDGTGKYKEFGNADLSRQNDDEIVRTAKIMEAAANKYLAQLVGEGLTQMRIDALKDARILLDDAIGEQRKAIRNRDSSTEERVEVGNALYELTSKYAEIGKDIWYDNNEAKYNDYVVYDTPSGKLEEESAGDAPSV